MNNHAQNYEINFSNQIEKKATGEYSTSQIPLNARENNFFIQQLANSNNNKKPQAKIKHFKFQDPFIQEVEIESFKEFNLRMCFQEYEEQPIMPLDTSKLCCGKKHSFKCSIV